MVEMCVVVMVYFKDGGVVVLFFLGVVFLFDMVFGLVIECEWNVFMV